VVDVPITPEAAGTLPPGLIQDIQRLPRAFEGFAVGVVFLSPRHCELSEAIQGPRHAARSLDCFAALAMTRESARPNPGVGVAAAALELELEVAGRAPGCVLVIG